MQELEKILEEIEQRIEKERKIITGHHHDEMANDIAETFAEAFIEAYEECQDIIRKHMNDGWIPVDDRLPEEGEKVLVWYEYFRYGEYNRMYETYGISWQYDGYWSGDVSGTKAKCIAWRPLPEPYREERSEGE